MDDEKRRREFLQDCSDRCERNCLAGNGVDAYTRLVLDSVQFSLVVARCSGRLFACKRVGDHASRAVVRNVVDAVVVMSIVAPRRMM